MFTRLICVALLVVSSGHRGIAADESAKKEEKPAETPKEKSKDKDPEKLVATHAKVVIDGKEISYTARAGVIQLKDAEDKPTASIFHIAYTRDDATNAAARPLTFSFNGGPGSSSVWLHMGLLGP